MNIICALCDSQAKISRVSWNPPYDFSILNNLLSETDGNVHFYRPHEKGTILLAPAHK